MLDDALAALAAAGILWIGYGGYRLIHATTARSFAVALTAFFAALFLLAGMAAIGRAVGIAAVERLTHSAEAH